MAGFLQVLRRVARYRLARFLVGLFVLALSLVFGSFAARAQSCPAPALPPQGGDYPDQGSAYAACAAAPAYANISGYYRSFQGCIMERPGLYRQWWKIEKNNSTCQPGPENTSPFGSFYYPAEQTCAVRPDQTGWLDPNPLDDVAPVYCSEGCIYEGATATGGGGVPVTWVASGDVCKVGDIPAPNTDADGDGVADGEDAFPNDPNESKDTDGDGIGDNADIADADAGNGEDMPGEEDGDDEGDNQASGGGDCNAPPSCSGDGIACNTNWQIWRMRCGAGGSVTGDVTNCGAAYTCNADPVQCAQLAVMRVEACKGGGEGVGDGEGDQPSWTVGAEPARPDEGTDDVEGVKRFGVWLDPSMLDTEEIFGAGACPALPDLEIFGFQVSAGLEEHWCTLVAIMRAVVLLMAGYFALQILMGRVV